MFGKFSKDPVTRWITEQGRDRNMELLEDFAFIENSGKEWRAKAGEIIDGASIPRAFWTIVGAPYAGDYRRASILHDVAVRASTGWRSRRRADKMFYRACRTGGCSRRDSIILYIGVRIGAWFGKSMLSADHASTTRLTETVEEREMKAVLQDVSEIVLSQHEADSDDPDLIEAMTDAALERKAYDLVAMKSVGPMDWPPEMFGRFERDGDTDDKNFNTLEAPAVVDAETLFGPDHPPLPTAGELYFREKLLDKPCGEEDRVPIENTASFPHSAICFLITTKFRRSARSTGFFIAPDTIITAGHSLKGWFGLVSSVQVIAGRDGRDYPFGSVWGRRWRVSDAWYSRGSVAADYGVIKLANGDLGEKVGHFDFDVLTDEELERATLTTSGYPSDVPNSRRQHTNSGPCSNARPKRLEYMLDTWKGASGSPVWVERDGKPVVVGVHNYGHCPNKATRVTEAVAEDFRRWIAM